MTKQFLTSLAKVLGILACVIGVFLLAPVSTTIAQPVLTGNVQVSTLADITGDAAAHALNSTLSGRWVQVICPSSNTAVVRIGDSSTSSTRGVPVPAGGGMMLPPLPAAPSMRLADQYYSLNTIYYYAATGDKVTILFGR